MHAASAAMTRHAVVLECIVSNMRTWQDCMAGSLKVSMAYIQVRWAWKMLLGRALLKSYRDFTLLQGRAALPMPSTAPQESVVSPRPLLVAGGTTCLLNAPGMQAVLSTGGPTAPGFG